MSALWSIKPRDDVHSMRSCRELSRFIAAGRLHAKIDKVGGIVETNRPDSKNYQYQVMSPWQLKAVGIIYSL